MIRLALRCLPADGRADLRWFSGLIGSLDEIYLFLLRAQIGEELAGSAADGPIRPKELRRIVDSRATELGGPMVRYRADVPVIELAVPVTTSTIPVQALASLASLFGAGPEVAAWSQHVKRAWFAAHDDSVGVRRAYEWLSRRATVSIVDDSPATPSVRRKRGKAGRPADLPAGVRRSPPLER